MLSCNCKAELNSKCKFELESSSGVELKVECERLRSRSIARACARVMRAARARHGLWACGHRVSVTVPGKVTIMVGP